MKIKSKPSLKSYIMDLQKKIKDDRKTPIKVEWTEKEWEMNPYTKRGKWVNKKRHGELLGKDTEGHTLIKTESGIIQRENYKVVK